MDNNMTSLEKMDAIGNLLDKLTDAQGRAKCGFIYIINEFVNDIRNDYLIMEQQLNDKKKEAIHDGDSYF